LVADFFVKHLIATMSLVCKSLAMKTIPKEPWLRGEMVSNRPSRTTPS
jgi:hypothetical protein